MEKSILMSVRPEHLVDILNGTKTLELRKTVPKDYKGWVYIYCTKKEVLERSQLGYRNIPERVFYNQGIGQNISGKVVARFWLDEYTKLKWFDGSLNNENMIEDYNYFYLEGNKRYYSVDWLLNNLQLTKVEVSNYGNKKELYAWHIKQLEIFNTPLSLNDFGITKAPQSWQYVYVPDELWELEGI